MNASLIIRINLKRTKSDSAGHLRKFPKRLASSKENNESPKKRFLKGYPTPKKCPLCTTPEILLLKLKKNSYHLVQLKITSNSTSVKPTDFRAIMVAAIHQIITIIIIIYNLLNSRLYQPGEPQNETHRKRKERQVLRPCQRTKKVMEHESDGDINYNWCARNGPQCFSKRAKRVRSRKTIRDYLNNSTTEIGQNTE